MDKITLDMDFGNDLEQNEDIEIPKAEKTKDEKREYLTDLIKEGLGQCEENAKNLSKLIEDIEPFLGTGITPEIIGVMQYLQGIFESNIPSLLRGNYDELIPEEMDGHELEAGLLIDLLKSVRKDLLKKIEDERNK
jgi:hypothetical protein